MNNQMNEYDNGNGYNNNNGGHNHGGNNNGNGGNQQKSPNWMIYLLSALAVLTIVMIFSNFFLSANSELDVEYSQFLEMLENGEIKTAVLGTDGYLTFTRKVEGEEELSPLAYQLASREFRTYVMEDSTALTQRLHENGVESFEADPSNGSAVIMSLLSFILPVLLMWVLLSFLFRKMSGNGGPFSVGKSTAKVYVQKETGVTFKDVAGEDEAKESLVEVVDFLHNPGRYAGIGARLPKGALLVGPPGTGKTLLAKAVAGEAHVPFFSLTGSDFIELYVGVGASRVRDLFKEATKNAPCIIFIDEIDAIGRSRDSKYGGGNEEREQTLNQLLSEMDGFDSSKGILIIGATNRPEILDKALLRPGRFDRRIIVDKPDLKGRVEILKVHAKNVKMDETVDLDAIALATSGAVGSDLANMINEAAINAVKEGRQLVNQKDLFSAVEQVLVGKEKKDRIMSKEERRIVSYHEVGHALVAALQKNSEPVQKITIVPRTMGALGYVMQVPEEEKYLNTEAELRDMLVGLVAGRAAEEIVFDTVTTGAANDIERATNIAKAMITQYGMSKKFGLMGLATVESQYLEGRASLNCSDETAAEIDQEVVDLLKESYEKALAMLRENRALMDKLAEFLIEKETITGKEFMEIFRREKGIEEPAPAQPETAEASKTSEETPKTPEAPKASEAPKTPDAPKASETPETTASSEQSDPRWSEVSKALAELTLPDASEEESGDEDSGPFGRPDAPRSDANAQGQDANGANAQGQDANGANAQGRDANGANAQNQDANDADTQPDDPSQPQNPHRVVGRFSNRPLDEP